MQLPGRLRSTSLGDLLGALHRAAATGTLELTEDRGRTHRVHLAGGLVSAVEVDGSSPSLAEILRSARAADEDVLRRSLLRAITSRRLHGEVLIDEFCLAPTVVGQALRQQLLARLGCLEQLADARLSFRVAVRPPRGSLMGRKPDGVGSSWDAPLGPRDFLHGRRRARERSTWLPCLEADPSAWRVLGLAPGADIAEVKRAYRQLARTVHPDLHPDATDEQRRVLEARFVELTDAYQVLVKVA
ncbi:MAG: J domain-containing protein [Polyangiaceae bacterium]|jgi:DnaJ-domain-containing protein 1